MLLRFLASSFKNGLTKLIELPDRCTTDYKRVKTTAKTATSSKPNNIQIKF